MSALRAEVPELRIRGIAAGLHLVVELPADVNDRALAAAASRAGLGPLPMSPARVLHGGRPGLIIGYATHTPDQLHAAARVLAELIRRAGLPGPGVARILER